MRIRAAWFSYLIRYIINLAFMSYLASNIKYLRKKKGLTQSAFADKIGINRSVVGAYEEKRADPRVQTLINICHYFEVSTDDLLHKDLSKDRAKISKLSGKDIRVLPVTINKSTQNEMVPLVPLKASAGYANGYGDIDFIESLPQFEIPFSELKNERSYRIFQIEGDSMLPLPSGAYIICTYIEDWRTIKNEQTYILISKDDGIVYKRIINELEDKNSILLKSDNTIYEPYSVGANDIKEVWKALGYVSFNLPDKGDFQPELNEMSEMLKSIQKDVASLKKAKT